jgi:hypothetical protein
LGCGGRTGSQANDAGSLRDATEIGSDTASAQSDALPMPLDANASEASAGSVDATEIGSDTALTQSDALPMPLDDVTMPPVLCDPSKCASGCCGATGCLSGTTSTACGFGGQSCTDCTALGLECISPMAGESGGVCGALDAGTMTDGAPGCGPTTCVGCCAGTICVAGTTNASCGSHGLACEQCTGANVACVAQGAAGACVGVGASCSPSNCAGCCDSNGICQDPAMIGACGTAGTSCQYCLPGQACNSGQCLTTAGCGPYNCLGCCQGDACLPGSIDMLACGSGGAQCQSCAASCQPLGPNNGGFCGADGAIGAGCATGSVECASGCCDTFGRCQPGNTQSYCAPPGQDCQTCSGSCVNRECAGGASCSLSCGGCCMPDGTCWTGGEDNAHCGGRGQLCFSCGPGYVCDSSGDSLFPICTVDCSLQNCPGCCIGGVCATGTDLSSCGTGGNACTPCTQGQSCLNGACITLSQCGPTLCAGCCQNDVCFVGSDDSACGSGGGPCQNCADAGDTCVGAACSP